jgi:hypothetical protein
VVRIVLDRSSTTARSDPHSAPRNRATKRMSRSGLALALGYRRAVAKESFMFRLSRNVTRYFAILGRSNRSSSMRVRYLRILAMAVRSRLD